MQRTRAPSIKHHGNLHTPVRPPSRRLTWRLAGGAGVRAEAWQLQVAARVGLIRASEAGINGIISTSTCKPRRDSSVSRRYDPKSSIFYVVNLEERHAFLPIAPARRS